jgi:hypothetical protein
MDDMMKVRKALFMFVDLFGVDRFDYDTLVRGAMPCYLTVNTVLLVIGDMRGLPTLLLGAFRALN